MKLKEINMIYTLDYLTKEAEMIASGWNGKDDKYVDLNGDVRTEDDVNAADELQVTLTHVKALIDELGI